MNESARTIRRAAGRAWAFVWAACLLSGCQTLRSPLDGLFGGKDRDDEIRRMANADDVRGPLQRLLSRRKKSKSLSPAAGRDEFEAAQKLFEDKKFKQAEKAAKKIAGKYKNSPVREDALFLIAEAQFRQKRYSWAQDSYDLVVKEFPSTRYLETRNKRLFAIARTWLDDPSYATSDNIQLADFNPDGARIHAAVKNKTKRGFDLSRSVPIFPNVWDRTRPVFDTDGRALQALKSIWQHDPTGTLADDALMLTASYYLRKGDYVEADHIFSILRDEYPKSRHAENAHVLGSFAKQASYQGPQYDDKVLDVAKELKTRTLRLYPDTPERARLQRDLRQIESAKAAADWEDVRFYQRKNRPVAVKIYCEDIIRDYPDTSYAEKARKVLAAMGEPTRRRRTRRPTPEPPRRKTPRLFRAPKLALPKLPHFGGSSTENKRPVERDSRADSPARVRL
ncbi:MAG: outer membrane protein assembly factor BamD [Planctomycetaceae bacterium]